MRKYTIEQYIRMAEKFNKLNFVKKIKAIQENKDLFEIANDGNWWAVRVKDPEMRGALDEMGILFEINKEWDHREIQALLSLLMIDLTDY